MVVTDDTVTALSHQQHGVRLASRVRAHYGALAWLGLSQLKLQKLCFYAAGVAWGHGAEDDLGELVFEAWKHGPVLREVFRPDGALPVVDGAPFSSTTEAHLADAVTVYGLISPWGLCEQSHTEEPWIEARKLDQPGRPGLISREDVTEHFKRKFVGAVQPPEHLVDRDGPRITHFAKSPALRRA